MKPCVALLQHGWADWEAGFVLSGLQDDFGIEVRVATPGADAVKSIGGVRALADLAFDEVDPAETGGLIVIGSGRWREAEEPALADALRRANVLGLPIGAICAGTLMAARAGLLDERAHTSNAPGTIEKHVPAYRGANHYRDAPHAIRSGNLVTAPGLAPITFAVEFFRVIAPDREDLVREFDEASRRELAAR